MKRKIKRAVKKVGSVVRPKPRLNAVKFGIAGGILSAFCVLLISIMYTFGYASLWMEMISEIYGIIGFTTATSIGMTLGVIYSFFDGFIATWLFALIYNKML